MSSKDGRIVVLGASGFVGRHVVTRAEQLGWEVLGLSSRDIDLATPTGATVLSRLLRVGDTVVHGAAIVPARNAKDLIQNLLMTQSVIEAIVDHNISQLVVISSDAVYGNESGVITESSNCSPDSMHGIMSLAREMMFGDLDVPVVTFVRPAPIYGKGDTHNSYGPNRFISQMIAGGEIVIFGEGDAIRDHVFIEDVADVVLRIITDRESGVINIASGESISFAKIAEIVCLAGPTGSKIKVSGSESTPTFRHFDISRLLHLYPDYDPVSPAAGTRRVIESIQGGVIRG